MVKESRKPRSWSRYVTSGAQNVPEDGAIWWDRTLARVDFPEPLSPIIPVTESGIVPESCEKQGVPSGHDRLSWEKEIGMKNPPLKNECARDVVLGGNLHSPQQ